MIPATLPKPSTIPAEPTTPMKLSEAIRLGSLVTLPTIGEFLVDGHSPQPRACAMGAAAYAHGARTAAEASDWVQDTPSRGGRTACPVRSCRSGFAAVPMVTHLNDDHRWSRERIADWLEEQGL